jgi:hypothetical protein
MYHTSYDAAKHTCQGHLSFFDQSDNEDGFFIYRAPAEGGEFERIATLPPEPKAEHGLAYIDETGYGDMTYLVAPYNSSGENRSEPLTLEYDAACPVTGGDGLLSIAGAIDFHNHILTVPVNTDLAYLYVKIADLAWDRIPDQGKFLPGTGSFDLSSYVDARIEQFAATDFEVNYEVWGWVDQKVQKLGTVKETIHRTILLVCSKGVGQCSGSGAGSGWVTDLEMPEDIPLSPDYALEFYWDTGIKKKIKSSRIDLGGSSGQYGYLNDKTSRLALWTVDWKGESDQHFVVHPAAYLYDPKQPLAYGDWDYGHYTYTTNWFMKDAKESSPFLMTLQAGFNNSNNSKLPLSNLVTLRYRNQKPAPPTTTLAPEIPSLYDLKLQNYTAPLLPHDEDWGCVIITNTAGGYTLGQKVCPSDYEPPVGQSGGQP